MTDAFDRFTSGLTAPATRAAAISPHDTNELAQYTRAIYVGGAGNLKVTTVAGDTVTLVGVLAGQIYPIRAKIIFLNGTTATNLVGLY